MRTVKTTKHKYNFYDSSKEIPIKRWNNFITKSVQSSQLGMDFSDCVKKLSQMDEYLSKGDRESFNNARINLQMQLYMIYTGQDLSLEALLELLHDIDGNTDFDPELIKQDTELTKGLVEELLESIRKK